MEPIRHPIKIRKGETFRMVFRLRHPGGAALSSAGCSMAMYIRQSHSAAPIAALTTENGRITLTDKTDAKGPYIEGVIEVPPGSSGTADMAPGKYQYDQAFVWSNGYTHGLFEGPAEVAVKMTPAPGG